MVLVVDDLQSADTPSLLLLQFVAREIGEVPLLIVGTYRDVELRRHHPLAETLGELARAPSSRSLVLEGLTLHDVARFIELATDRVPAATLVTAVHRKTEGNPFFLTEVLRLLATEGHDWTLARPEAAIGVPHRVREAIDLRLRALSEDCQRLLAVAAVIGREFSLGVLEAVAAIAPASPGGGIAALLDEAVAVRLVAVAPNHVGRYSFLTRWFATHFVMA